MKARTECPGIRRAESIGAQIAIYAFVFAQAAEFTIVRLGGSFDLSVQKLLSFVAMPVALLAMGAVAFPLSLLVMAALLMVANSAWYFVAGSLVDPRLLGANAAVLTGAAGAAVLYTALTRDDEMLDRFLAAWAWIAAVSATVTVLQAVGIVPLFTVPPEFRYARAAAAGLYRGVGFKYDPNHQAVFLLMGYIAARLALPSARSRRIVVGVVTFGILATFSRMGLAVYALISILLPVLRARAEGRPGSRALLGSLRAMVGISVLATAVFVAGPASIRLYAQTRVMELVSLSQAERIDDIHLGEGSSAAERAMLAYAAFDLAKDHYRVGVGGGRTRDALYARIGVRKVAHNIYLEMFLTGGLFGLLAVLAYMILTTSAVRTKSVFSPPAHTAAALLAITFGAVGCFLTISTTIIWAPIVFASAWADRARRSPTWESVR